MVRPRVRPPLFAALFAVAVATPAFGAPAAASAGSLPPELGLPLQRYFSSEDYDGFSRVTAVAHTAEGFTVFGTYHAAILFDGSTHEKIPVPATYVTALCRDGDGTLWAGGDNEIGVIAPDPDDGRLRYVSRTSRLPAAAGMFGRMRALVAGADGVFAATSNGLLHFSADRADFFPLPPDSRPQLFSLGGRIFLQDQQRGLHVFERGGFRAVAGGAATVGRELHLAERRDGAALAVLEGDGLHTFDAVSGRLERLPSPLDPLVAVPLLCALPLPDGRTIFVRANSRGIVIADAALRGAQLLDAKSGLANPAILGAAVDTDRGLWLGTANGLIRLDLAPGVTVFDERNAFPIGSSGSLVRHDGVLYAGSTHGLMRLEPGRPAAGIPARFVPDPRVPESCDNLRSTPAGLLFGSDDTVELLAPSGRRRVFDPQAKITMIKTSTAAPGRFFVAAADGGVHLLDLKAGTARRLLTLPPGVLLWNGTEDTDGSLWVGTAASGFWRIASAEGDWNRVTLESHPLGKDGLPDGKSWTGVYTLFNELHFLTETGMYRWHPATRTFSPDDRYRIEGVEPLRFMPIIADPTGRAWTTAWAGTVAAARTFGYFRADSPAAFKWHDAPAVWQAGVGRFGAGLIAVEADGDRPVIWTKSPTAIARLELDSLDAPPAGASWRPVIRRFMTGERSWPIREGGELHLPFSNLPTTLRFAAPRYRSGAALRYQTRLLGFREEWSAPAPGNETVFTNLIGGPFVFEVRAVDADGIVSEPARLTFRVAPPWHRSPGALAGYAVAALAAIAGFIRWRLRHAESERTRLEQLVAQRTAELKVAKDAADSANRAKSLFLANMSHELRTPLNGVIGYAQVLNKDRDLSPRNRERVQIVQSAGEHLLRMINEVLDFSKIEAGRMELAPAPFHLPQLLRDIAAALSDRFEKKGLAFAFTPAPDLPDLVIGDAIKLRQVLDNLLGNALKFTPRGGVTFEVAVRDAATETIAFAVRDTGVGIAPADRERLFQPFQQATDGRPPEPGTGLGLAISRRLVELMGGALELDSAPGAGSTFRFAVRLPVLAADAATERRHAGEITGYRGPRRRLLVVDDVAINRSVLRELLAPLGFEIREAVDGPTALDLAARERPDLVLLDLRMGGMDGFALARQLRAAHGPGLKLVAMSASVLTFGRDDAFAAGCDDFLPKPFREDELLARLGMALQVEWTGEAAETAAVPARAVTALDAAVIDELLGFARRGEISPLRRRLADLRGDPLADALEPLAKTYRMENIRTLLETQAGRRSDRA